MKLSHTMLVLVLTIFSLACQKNMIQETNSTTTPTSESSAKVIGVTITGDSGNYNLSVTLESPDTGCDQYADWWEVFTPDETLIYRRILAHSHVDEQPFTRSGGPVAVAADQEIIVRAHMNNLGYGTQVYRGTIGEGLTQVTLPIEVGAELETTEPLPQNCAF